MLKFKVSFKSEESIWLKVEYILELAQWLYSHEYSWRDCIDLAEWAVDLLMYSVKSDKGSHLYSAPNSSLAMLHSQSKLSAKKPVKPHGPSHQILPTIKDEEDDMHSQLIKNTQSEFDLLAKSVDKETLFGI